MSHRATRARRRAGTCASSRRPTPPRTDLHQLTTADGATVAGVLRTVPGAHHRRDDHASAPGPDPPPAGAGAAAGRRSRSGPRAPGRRTTTCRWCTSRPCSTSPPGIVFLRDLGFADVVTLGHSGGGALFAFYHEQAGLPPSARGCHDARRSALRAGRRRDARGRRGDLPGAAPRPGRPAACGCIDPSVTDESDPLVADPELDLFDPANGFATAPRSSTYSPEFLDRYRRAQRARIERHRRRRAGNASPKPADARRGRRGDPPDRGRPRAR